MGHAAVACGASRLGSKEGDDGVDCWQLFPDQAGEWAVFYAQNKSTRDNRVNPSENCVPALAAPRAEVVRLTPDAFVEYYLQRCKPFSQFGEVPEVPTPWTTTGSGTTDKV